MVCSMAKTKKRMFASRTGVLVRRGASRTNCITLAAVAYPVRAVGMTDGE